MRRCSSLGLMEIIVALLRVAVGLRRGCFAVLPALFAGAFLLASNVRAEFLYVANLGSGTISGYTVGFHGNLKPITGSPFAAGKTPSTIGIDIVGGFLYAPLENAGRVVGYSIGETGALTPVPGSPFAVGAAGQKILSLAVDSLGGFVYVTGSPTGVFAYSIGSNGSLTSITGSPFSTGIGPLDIAVDPNGEFVYVCDETDKAVLGYNIASNGVLGTIAGSPFSVESSPTSVAVDPTASFAFVTGSNNIKVESIGQTGALTFVEQKTLSRAVGAAVDPTGTFLYVTSDDTNNVAGYRISSTGNLTHIPDSPFCNRQSTFCRSCR